MLFVYQSAISNYCFLISSLMQNLKKYVQNIYKVESRNEALKNDGWIYIQMYLQWIDRLM